MEWYHYTTACIYIVLILGGVVINGGFILLFTFSREIRKAVNPFMVSLAVSDILFPLVVVPFHLQHLISGTWKYGVLGCKLRTFAYLATASASILSFCSVSVARFLRIIYPFRFNMIHDKTVWITALLLWLYSFGSSAFVFAADTFQRSQIQKHSSCFHFLPIDLFIPLFLLNYCTPLLVMLSIYGCILKLSWRHRKQISHTRVSPANLATNSRAKKASKQLITVFLLLSYFGEWWLPILGLSLRLKTQYNSELDWPRWTAPVYQFLSISVFLNSVVNPFVYGYSNTHLKAALRHLIRKRSSKGNLLSTQLTTFVVPSHLPSS